jgi:hypothetical protein
MDSQRLVALLVFVGVLLAGIVSAGYVLDRARDRRYQRQGQALEAFLVNLSEENEGDISGAPAVVIKQDPAGNYADEPPKEASVYIHTGDVPRSEEIRRAWEQRRLLERRRQIQEILRERVQTIARGAVVVDGNPLLVRNVRIEDEIARADLLARNGAKIGHLELTSKDGKVVEGTMQIEEEGARAKYDIFISLEHPNKTNLYRTVQAVRLVDRADAIRAIKASYNATAVQTSNAD